MCYKRTFQLLPCNVIEASYLSFFKCGIKKLSCNLLNSRASLKELKMSFLSVIEGKKHINHIDDELVKIIALHAE